MYQKYFRFPNFIKNWFSNFGSKILHSYTDSRQNSEIYNLHLLNETVLFKME